MRVVCAILILLGIPGPSVWAQVAAVRSVPAAAPVSPVVPQAPLSSPGLGLSPAAMPGLTAPSLLSPALELPKPAASSPTLQPAAAALAAPAASPAAAAALAAPAASPAAPLSAPAAAVAETSRRMGETVRAAAPHLEAAASQGTGASQSHAAGLELEKVLTGIRTVPEAASFATGEPASRGRPAAARLEAAAEQAAQTAQAERVPEPLPPGAERRFKFYAAGVSAVKVGIETLNLVVPILLLTQYGTAAILGTLFVSAQVAGLISGAVAGPLLDKVGPAKALGFSAALQAMVIGVVPVSLLLGTPVSLPVIFGLFVANGALSGIFDIARRAALPGILGTDEAVLRKYNAKLYIVREIAAMGSVFGAGWLLHQVGALATLALHPGAYAVAALSFILLSRGFRGAATGPAVPEDGEEPSLSSWADLAAGARLVLKDPALRLAAAVNIPVIAFHNLFHAMLAAVYATSVLGSPAMAAVLIGAWNAGELAAAFYMDKRGSDGASVSWIRYAALTSLAGWALWAFPTIWVAAPMAFILATGTLGNEIGLASFFQATAPKERVGAVTGFVYSAATAVAMGFILAVGAAFDAWGAGVGMLALAGVLTAFSAFYLFAARKLAARLARSGD